MSPNVFTFKEAPVDTDTKEEQLRQRNTAMLSVPPITIPYLSSNVDDKSLPCRLLLSTLVKIRLPRTSLITYLTFMSVDRSQASRVVRPVPVPYRAGF